MFSGCDLGGRAGSPAYFTGGYCTRSTDLHSSSQAKRSGGKAASNQMHGSRKRSAQGQPKASKRVAGEAKRLDAWPAIAEARVDASVAPLGMAADTTGSGRRDTNTGTGVNKTTGAAGSEIDVVVAAAAAAPSSVAAAATAPPAAAATLEAVAGGSGTTEDTVLALEGASKDALAKYKTLDADYVAKPKLPRARAKRLEVYKSVVGEFLARVEEATQQDTLDDFFYQVVLTTDVSAWREQWERELKETYGVKVMATEAGIVIVDVLASGQGHGRAVADIVFQLGDPGGIGLPLAPSSDTGFEFGARPGLSPDVEWSPIFGSAGEVRREGILRPRWVFEFEASHRGPKACLIDFHNYFTATAVAPLRAAAQDSELTRMVVVIKVVKYTGAGAGIAMAAIAWERDSNNNNAIAVSQVIDCGVVPLKDATKRAWAKDHRIVGVQAALPPVSLGSWGQPHLAGGGQPAVLTIPIDVVVHESRTSGGAPLVFPAGVGAPTVDLHRILEMYRLS